MTNYDYLYDKSFFGDKLEQNHFSSKNLNFRIFHNATVLPHVDVSGTNGFGGIIDADGNFVDGTFLHRNTGGAYTPNFIVDSPETVVYLGMLVSIWGHEITDNLKRAWFFKNETYRRYFRKIPAIYTKMWGGAAGTSRS